MALFSNDDLAEFVDLGTLGTVATYNSTTINVVFTDNYVSITGGTVDIEGTYPVALCRTVDVSGVAHGSTLTINSIAYVVIGVQPNLTAGTTKLILNQP
jgi:hypothetical protein